MAIARHDRHVTVGGIRTATAQGNGTPARNARLGHVPTGGRSLQHLRNREIVFPNRIDEVVLDGQRSDLFDQVELELYPLIHPHRDDSLVVATVKVIFAIYKQGFDFVAAFEQFFDLVRLQGIRQAADRPVATAGVYPALGVGGHRVDPGLVDGNFLLQGEIFGPYLGFGDNS